MRHDPSRCSFGLLLLFAGSLMSFFMAHSGNAQEAPAGTEPEPDTVSRTVYDLGDHTVDFRQVTEETLPTLPPKAEPIVPSEPSPELLAQRRAPGPAGVTLCAGPGALLLPPPGRRDPAGV